MGQLLDNLPTFVETPTIFTNICRREKRIHLTLLRLVIFSL